MQFFLYTLRWKLYLLLCCVKLFWVLLPTVYSRGTCIFVTGIALATFRVLMFLFNNTLIFGAIVVLSTVVVFWVVSKAVEKVPFIKGNLDTHSQIEKTTAKHFRELKLIGALVLQVNFCLLLLGYCLFFELSDLYCLVITERYFFLPCSLILPMSLVFVNCMESIIRVYFNQT